MAQPKSELGRWMQENDVKDDALSAQVGVSRVQITRLRNGQNKPSRETALRLQEITGISASTLIFGESSAA